MVQNVTALTQTEKSEMFIRAQKTLGRDEFTKLVATAAITPIAEQVIENAIMRTLLPIDRFDNGPAIMYTTKKRNRAAVVTPRYGAAPVYHTRYTRILVEPYIITHNPEVSVIDIMDANFNMVQDILEDAGKEIAVKEDTDALAAFNAALVDPGGSFPTTTDVLTVSAGPGGIGHVLSSNVLRVGTSQAAPAGGVAGDPTIQNFLTAQADLNQIGYSADTLLMNPYTMGKIAGNESFMLYLNFGARDVFEKGYIQSALGLTLLVHPLVAQKSLYLFDQKEFARFIERNPLTMETSTEKLISSWFMWERVCTFIRNANAAIRLMYNV